MTTEVLMGIGVLVAVVGVIVAIVLLRRSEGDPLSDRIEDFAAREEAVSIEEIELTLGFSERVLVPTIRKLADFITRFTPQEALESTTRRIELAGSPRNMSAAELWAISGVLGLVLGGIGILMGFRFEVSALQRIGLPFVFGGLGVGLPHMLIKSMIDRRQQAIVKKLPDALDLMTICVDAGLTFDGAMSKVDEKWDDALAQDFGRVIQEMQLGKTKRQALKDMSNRMDVADITSFVASILQAEQLGVSVGKVLRIQAEQMRVKRRQRAEEKAQQAPVKMLFPMVFLIFPSIFVVLLGPAIMQAIRNPALKNLGG
ncbi:MAG TPA: type II secretion system F family protein [Anaerolineae bacterium]|nr:type II secretion system F family protein [Anaerolineae bacterium]